jgi:hypothetical protein
MIFVCLCAFEFCTYGGFPAGFFDRFSSLRLLCRLGISQATETLCEVRARSLFWRFVWTPVQNFVSLAEYVSAKGLLFQKIIGGRDELLLPARPGKTSRAWDCAYRLPVSRRIAFGI